MPQSPTLGEQELALLRFVAQSGPVSVGEAAQGFGAPRGLARTTVLTMMERLRRKGRLRRRRTRGSDGVFRYSSTVGARELLAATVRDFVAGPLGGSLEPFVAYLAESEEVSPEERRELEALVERLRGRGAETREEES
jgi:predicted transcriptional regulator